MDINLPIDNVDLWRTSHAFAWLFRKQFGFFPDRNGSWMEAGLNYWTMHTEQVISSELKQQIKDFVLNETNFVKPVFSNLLILDLDYIAIESELKTFLAEEDFVYVGKGHEQHIYFLRALTVQEKKQVKEVLISHVNFY